MNQKVSFESITIWAYLLVELFSESTSPAIGKQQYFSCMISIFFNLNII